MSNSNKKNNKKEVAKKAVALGAALGVVAGIGANMAGGAEEAGLYPHPPGHRGLEARSAGHPRERAARDLLDAGRESGQTGEAGPCNGSGRRQHRHGRLPYCCPYGCRGRIPYLSPYQK